jgi:hypothetical protein
MKKDLQDEEFFWDCRVCGHTEVLCQECWAKNHDKVATFTKVEGQDKLFES